MRNLRFGRWAVAIADSLVESPVALYVFFEVALGLVYMAWAVYRGEQLRVSFRMTELCAGLILTGPLLLINYTFFFTALIPQKTQLEFAIFLKQVVRPFVRSLNLQQATLLAYSAGIGEELFFRGVLQSELGIFASSLLFAALHFGPALPRFPRVATLYFIVSLYLGAVSKLSLGAVIVTHVTYDLFALLYLIFTSNVTGRQKEELQQIDREDGGDEDVEANL